MTEVTAPDGSIITFPDDASKDEIHKAMMEHFGDPRRVYGSTATQADITPKGPVWPGLGIRAVQGMPVVGGLATQQMPQSVQDIGKKFTKDYPSGAFGADLAGGAVGTLPLMAAPGVAAAFGGAEGASALRNAVAGGAGGGVLGAADAASRGENPYVGGFYGTSLGAGAPLLAAGVGKAANLASRAPVELQGMGDTARNWLTRGVQASGLSDPAIAAQLKRLGPEGFLAEYGENLKARAGHIAANPGEGMEQIFGGFNERAKGMRDRLEQDITRVAGPRQNMVDLERDSKEARAKASDPLYEAWRNTTVPPTPELYALADRINKTGAFVNANRLMAIDGKPATINFGGRDMPTAESWDYAKRALDDKVRTALQSGNRNEARIYGGLQKELVNALDNHPDPQVAGVYRAARRQFASHSELIDAREAGRNIFDPNESADEFADRISRMSPPAQRAHLEGARDAYAQLMDASTRGENEQVRAGTLTKLLTPQNQAKMELLHGPQGRDELTNSFKRELAFNANEADIIRNSKTAARQSVAQEMTPGKDTWISRAREIGVNPATWLPNAMEQHAIQRQANTFGRGYGEAGNALMAQGQEAANLARALRDYQPPGPKYEKWTNRALQLGVLPETRRGLQKNQPTP